MRILISPDKFKGSLGASEVCRTIADILNAHGIDTIEHPLADGGDGSLELLESYLHLEKANVETIDPLGRPLSTVYLYKGDQAFIELASASGHVLLTREEMNPMKTSTRGTGLMIAHAIKEGKKQITLFLGGSATNDAGTGILHELGYRFLDKDAQVLFPSGENLARMHSIQFVGDEKLKKIEFRLLCDVNNPLYGPSGAAHIYARQKGASPKEVECLDAGLKNFAQCMYRFAGVDVQFIPGSGAAGGIPGGLLPVLNAKKEFGAESFLNLTKYDDMLDQVDLVITGEGCLDAQSMNGKLVDYVTKAATQKDLPVYYFVGMCKYNELPGLNRSHVFAIHDIADNLNDALSNAQGHLRRLTLNFVQAL